MTVSTTAGRARRKPAPAPKSPVATVVRLLNRPQASYYLVIGSAAALLVLGLVMVLSASSVTSYTSSGSSFTIASRQALWVVIGLPVLLIGARLPVKAYRMLAYPMMLISIALLLAVLVPGVGQNVSGATRWIALPGGMQLQPSEPAKLALVLWGADLLSRKEKRLGEAKHLLVPLVPMALLIALLVMAEPDMGTTIVLMVVLLALLFTAGAPMWLFARLGIGLAGLAGLLAVTEPYRLRRLVGFRDPCAEGHALSVGYQACQGLYALSSGGWFGVGLGGSREKFGYLPNLYTDYIFAIIGEELGLLGSLLVLGLFALLAYAGIRIAQRCRDTFSQLAAAGVTAWLLGQALVNMGAVVGLLPITGIPLPLVSFGGSALVPTMFAIGMLISFARNEPATAKALSARRKARGRLPRFAWAR
ncbi:MAG TPA: putative lipid II flippase FtsW [Mycobacteriales bacterium]|jgi:cell division protein FtsW|nr:putative lipid II flippase FtsW [Mycobacteriales bacterium]